MKITYTCPIIDDVIDLIKIQNFDEVYPKLEELRDINKALRYDMNYWKNQAEFFRTGIEKFNPETLPKI